MNTNLDLLKSHNETKEGTEHETRLLATVRVMATVTTTNPEKQTKLQNGFSKWKSEQLEKALIENLALNNEQSVSDQYKEWVEDFREHGELLVSQDRGETSEQKAAQIYNYYHQRGEDFLRHFGARTEIDTALKDINRVQDRLFKSAAKDGKPHVFVDDYRAFEAAHDIRESMTPARQELSAKFKAVMGNKNSTPEERGRADRELKLANSVYREDLWQNVLDMELLIHGESDLWRRAGTMVEKEQARQAAFGNNSQGEGAGYELKPRSAHQAAEAVRGVRAKLSEYVPAHTLPAPEKSEAEAQARGGMRR